MFSTFGLFKQLACPTTNCERINCPFSHVPVQLSGLPVDDLKSFLSTTEQPGSVSSSLRPPSLAGGKRPLSPSTSEEIDHRSKIMRTKNRRKPVPVAPSRTAPSASTIFPPTSATSTRINTVNTVNNTGGNKGTDDEGGGGREVKPEELKPPVINTSPMTSKIPLAMRQTMLTTLYNHFVDLYRNFHQHRPEIAHRDALKQEEEVYAKTNKASYKNAMISSIVSVKKRQVPDSPSHPSVGSEGERMKRKAKPQNRILSYTLTLEDVEPLLLDPKSMKKYGIPTEVPSTPGGTQPSINDGAEVTCDRCLESAVIRYNSDLNACQFHWGKPMRIQTDGRSTRIRSCCSAPYPLSEGCQTGPHVFAEKEVHELHVRHGFTHTSLAENDSALEIATLDCEGIYTTQGMSIARVSVCDGEGKLVFDELIRPDPGVEVIDYNTRFSGVTSLESALLDLAGIRKALDSLIGPKTVIIGHSVENDLLMLRMTHPRLVDTADLYPHHAGYPYRRALRALSQEYLGRSIQTGDETVGHSSAEDALATLDLVKHYVLDQRRKKQRG